MDPAQFTACHLNLLGFNSRVHHYCDTIVNMPRSLSALQDPVNINTIQSGGQLQTTLEVATSNVKKLTELQTLLPEYKILGIDLGVDEVQSLSSEVVAKKKALAAWQKNDFNPILVEDTSLEIAGIGNLPGTLATFFTSDPHIREQIAKVWLKGKNRSAVAKVTLAIHDGTETHTFEGRTLGKIANEPLGDPSDWDDIFIPNGATKTFGQMTLAEKNKFSMRAKAVAEFKKTKLVLKSRVLCLPEPFNSELERINTGKLATTKALKFAFMAEGVSGNKPSKNFDANTYEPLVEEKNNYYLRYKINSNSPSIGLVLTDVDRAQNKRYSNGKPIIWQMGPERRKLALAQRAQYFLDNTDKKVVQSVVNLSKQTIPPRVNSRSNAVETMLYGESKSYNAIHAHAVKELGYKKITSQKIISRQSISKFGLFNKIGKYHRLMLGIGSMPAVSGWKDVLVTSAIGYIPTFIARNNILAENPALRIDLINSAKSNIKDLGLSKKHEHMALLNIGVAIGTNDPKYEVKQATELYEKAGIKLFRIYTINGDPRCIETAELLRKTLGNDIEIFAGQLTEKEQAVQYMEKADVDALIFGHGGGRQCTSAINGMAISTVEEIYSITTDRYFNNTTLLIEGGVGRNVGPLLLLGIDGILYNQQLVRGTLEIGGFFIENRAGEYGQPYHGSASSPTMIIEAANDRLKDARINYSGRTKVPEGKPGFSAYSEKANSMAFWIDEFKHHLARTMADLGVENIIELRELLQKTDKELLRTVSPEAAVTASPYGTLK